MLKFKKDLNNNEFLTMLKLLDEGYLIVAMGTIVPEMTIEETNDFVDNLMDDIPTLLQHQSNLDEPITNYKFIKTGIYYYEISVADTVFELIDDTDWLWYKEELIEYFKNNDF